MHIQELQKLLLMLCRMAIHLFGKMVAIHQGNITAKAYLCDIGGTVLPFLSRVANYILKLTNKHGITLIPAYIPTISMLKPVISHGNGWFQNGIFFIA